MTGRVSCAAAVLMPMVYLGEILAGVIALAAGKDRQAREVDVNPEILKPAGIARLRLAGEKKEMVEQKGLEPSTPTLRTWCSPS